jgi:hypothetical protein
VGQLLFTSDRDTVDNVVVRENVRLGVRGHLYALEGCSHQRSKSASQHVPGPGTGGAHDHAKWKPHRQLQAIRMRELRARRTCLRHRVFLLS